MARSSASIGKHPLHPMIIPLPIGLWIFSIVADIIFKMGWGGAAWNDAAFYTIGAGIVGALVAALPGMIDLTGITNPKTKSIGIWHMSFNLIAVVVYGIDLWLRTRRPAGDILPIMLSVVGIILITISGWLGGELVYVRGVAVEEPPDESV